jgi:hypothetical protein
MREGDSRSAKRMPRADRRQSSRGLEAERRNDDLAEIVEPLSGNGCVRALDEPHTEDRVRDGVCPVCAGGAYAAGQAISREGVLEAF